MSKFFLFCVTFLLLITSSALSKDVDFRFDNTADFSKFKTYKWITLEKIAPIEGLTDEQIKAAVDAALVRKGLTKVDGETADLLIGYQTKEKSQPQYPGIDPDSGVRTPFPTTTSKSTSFEGQLAIEMYDPANHHLIWRGVATKTVYRKAEPEKRQKNLNKAVAKLMENYPPPK